MAKYIARRILAIIPVCLGISIVVFAMIHLVPGDPAITLVGPNSTPDTLAKVRQSLGLTAPVYVQYGRWLAKAVHADLGLSIHMDQPVLPELLSRFRIVTPCCPALLLQSPSALVLALWQHLPAVQSWTD
jgi:peptide/nickel transport system permease protein